MRPLLFVTDINNAGVPTPNPRGGDWQFHGDETNKPDALFGTWKGATKIIDHTVSPATESVTPDADPTKSDWHLGAGSDPAPLGLTDQGYGAEVRRKVSDLKLTDTHDPNYGSPLKAGHVYRFQFMVHDGDQNKVGGDTGEACVNTQFR